MAKAQIDRFTDAQQDLARLAKALSHPARIAILEVLPARKVCLCGEVVDELPLSQATVSQHLKVLKEAGLVSGEIEGARSCYCVDWKSLSQAQELISTWFKRADDIKRSCC